MPRLLLTMKNNSSEKPYIPTVEDMWQIYLDTLPPAFTEQQIRHAKRSFFCGIRASFMMFEQIAAVVGTGERAMLHAELLKQECEQFADSVQRGKA